MAYDRHQLSRLTTEMSFQAMDELQQNGRAATKRGSTHARRSCRRQCRLSLGTTASVNQASLFISLKPLAERSGLSAQAVANRSRQKIDDIPGCGSTSSPMQDVRVGGAPGGAGRRSAAGHAAKAGTNTSGAGGLYPSDLDDDLSFPQRIEHLCVQVRCASAH